MSANLEEILSTSRMVRDAINRGRRKLDAIDAPAVYCYSPHTQEVRNLFRLIFVMAPLHSCSYANQLPTEGHPIFAYAAPHEQPVPQEFWDRLGSTVALYLRIETSRNNE